MVNDERNGKEAQEDKHGATIYKKLKGQGSERLLETIVDPFTGEKTSRDSISGFKVSIEIVYFPNDEVKDDCLKLDWFSRESDKPENLSSHSKSSL